MMVTKLIVVVLWAAVTLYAIFGGADFGGGFWDLTAGGPETGKPRRDLIDRAIGPVWETNHIWLIFVLVVMWTCFPKAFVPIMTTLYIPLTLVAVGIICRGSAFAFRHTVVRMQSQRFFGALFALASVVTPFFLGTVAGGIASGRVPLGNAAGDPFTSWLNPTSILGGVLAVLTCAFMAGVLLTHEAQTRSGDEALISAFRARALGAAVATGIVAFAGIFVIRSDAPTLFTGLTGDAAPLVVLSAIAGTASISLVFTRRFLWARVSAVVAVGSVIWAWGVGQYPWMLVNVLTIDDAAAPQATLQAVAIVAVLGAILLVPALILLYVLAERSMLGEDDVAHDDLGDAFDEAPAGAPGTGAGRG